jgi:hypothetical protein
MLTIKNFDKDRNSMIVWGWDLLQADEFSDLYSFQLASREPISISRRTYFTLTRYKQYGPQHPEKRYQLHCTDDEGAWEERIWLTDSDLINHSNFLAIVEDVLNKNVGNI